MRPKRISHCCVEGLFDMPDTESLVPALVPVAGRSPVRMLLEANFLSVGIRQPSRWRTQFE